MRIFSPRNKNFTLISFTVLILVCCSCTQKKNKEICIHSLTHTDFENSLTVDGVVEAVRSVTLSCPRGTEGEVIYLIEDGKKVEAGEVVAILENRELQNDYEQMLIEVENTKAIQNKSKVELEMRYAILDAQVKNNIAQTAIANLDSLQLEFASPVQRQIKELELEKANIIRTKLQRKLKALNIINKSQIRRMELQILRRENRASSIKDRLEMLTIKAPQAGMALRAISNMTGRKILEGDQVWGNMPLITIPDLTEMKVKILASEASYKRINLKDAVEYSFDAMPGNFARGKITNKAPVGQAVKENSKVKFFEIEATIDSAGILPKPGLTTSCKIIILRIKDTIVVPQLAIFEEDSTKFVYVKQLEGFERREIKTGASSPKSAVIIAGLSGSESLSLIKPTASDILKNTFLPKAKKTKKKK